MNHGSGIGVFFNNMQKEGKADQTWRGSSLTRLDYMCRQTWALLITVKIFPVYRSIFYPYYSYNI